MLVEKICGNLRDYDTQSLNIDTIEIDWYDTRKKIARLKTSQGREIGMKLTNFSQNGLNHGDILHVSKDCIIAIVIRPVKVLYLYMKDMASIVRIVYEIGNRHLPLFFGTQAMELQTPFEKPLQILLDKMQIQYEIKDSILDSKDRLSVSMPHSEIQKKIEISNDFEVRIIKKD